MNTVQKITKNVSVLFISQMLSYVLGFFTLIYSARYLGVGGFGTLSLALAITGIFSVCIDLGLNTLSIREIARNKNLANDYIGNTIILRGILSLITLVSVLLLSYFIGYNPETIEVILIITIYTIFNAFSQMLYSLFQAFEKMEYQSIGIVSSNILLLAGILLAIHYKTDLIQFAIVYVITSIIILIYSLIICYRKFLVPDVNFRSTKWKELLKESWPFAITGISINIYLWIDTLILSVMKGQEAVGFYNASYKLILVLLFIPIVLNTALFPLMSKYYASSIKTLKISFEKLFKITMLIAIPIGIGTVLTANKIILLFYGSQYLKSVIALQILIWSTVLIFARNPFERLLAASDKQITTTKIFLIGVIFNVTTNLIIIPHYSYIGAAIVIILTDILVLTLFILSAGKFGYSLSKNSQISLVKAILASIIMGLFLIWLNKINIFLLILIGFTIYVISLLILKILDDDEILMIKSIFKKKL
ncbi:flippase [Methanobacterium petrolearium]|uniref:flippase n=1 Tax=Methanobacterium petrolearium TaxID=710190 RepID=UPI001AEA5327|nr:flippase [Methanobacterium petrolearium]MBP1945461.1 O-antigen/teichoic acid export membrane protein [Methanobacterium petrolearium]